MEKIEFSCTVENNSNFDDLGLEFWVDNNKFFDSAIPIGVTPIKYDFDEDESDHILKIVFKNKTTDHTTVDNDGTILTDALLTVKDFEFDEINIDQLFFDNAVYAHDYNGSGKQVTEQFYGNLGCNGTVKLQFSTPFYIWLLENM